MDAETKKKQLAARRRTLLAAIDRAAKFIQDYDAGRDALQVPLRLENLETVWQGLEEVQLGLEELDTTEEQVVSSNEIRSDFEARLFQAKAGLIALVPAPVNPPNNLPPNSPQNPPAGSGLSGLKLPTIALPEFDGDYQDWLNFHDTFSALIHQNDEVADIQKFHYLRAAVKGEAAQVIESITISAANYRLAWESLVLRYSNEYLLKKRHLQALLETPRMKNESATSLHLLVDEFERHTKILKQLGEPTDAWSTMLEHLLCTRLHDETLKMWEDHASTIEQPTYKNLVDFLQRRVRVLESISVNHDSVASIPLSQGGATFGPGSSASFQRQGKSFQQNLSAHAITEGASRLGVSMRQFKKMSLSDKINTICAKRLCFNCLYEGHYVSDCPVDIGCRFCNKRHHSMIHPGYVDNADPVQGPSNTVERPRVNAYTNARTNNVASVTASNDVAVSKVYVHAQRNSNVFMLTAVLVIVDAYGQEHLARALLDCASQPNLITDRMVQLLKLKRSKTNVKLQGPGGVSIHATNSVFAQIRSRKEPFSQDVAFLVLPQVTASTPEHDVPIDDWNIPKDLFLADPNFHKRGGIDMIIGLPHFFSCFKTTARVRLANDLPELVDSVFGWLVAGSGELVPASSEYVSCNVTSICLVTLEESLERFWRVEELPARSDYSVEERECEELFVSTTTRDQTGRYMVRLPRHPDFGCMVGDSKAIAMQRFMLLERRFRRNENLKNEYHRFMQEYIALGHMRLVAVEDERSTGYYLPHHPVFKEESTTTKTRVVFDGSSKTSAGFSLNDALRVGPVVQDDLISIILRFRKYPVALVADIEKMYRQVLVHPDDAKYQRILWRFSEDEPVHTYELRTVTYGLAPSSFLATRTLQQLADDEGKNYPLAEPLLRRGFYVDDCLGGADSIEEALLLREELSSLLEKGGFNLRKWTSNKLEVLQGLEPDQIGTQSSLTFTPNETIKTLGIGWEPEQDMLRFDSRVKPSTEPTTKRSILSSIAQLFDPLGLIAPVVIRGKLLMQELWLAHCDWDQQVPEHIQKKWDIYHNELPKICAFRIERYAFQPHSSFQLHTFTDASEKAYGACVYARSCDAQGRIQVQLLASKSRVAPLKRITLPRLELCAAAVGAQLYAHVANALQIEVSAAYFWSDSMVTLQWLQSPPSNWKTFVANRVSEIQSTTHGSRWNHVASKENPADLVSRGMDVDEFLESKLWKHGPAWLMQQEEQWPNPTPIPPQIESVETKQLVTAVVSSNSNVNPFFVKFSSFNLLIRTTAYCLRFIDNARSKARTCPQSPSTCPSKALSTTQLQVAKDRLVRLAQQDAFCQEIKDLKRGNTLSKQSSIRLLSPFLDQEGTIRVGGRLRLSDQIYQTKHPALLPSFHPYSRMIVKFYHLKLLHGGGQLVLSTMRENYWPVNGRRMIRSVLRNCFQCARVDPVPAQQQIGQLPAARVTPSRPFYVTGVDYAGPIYLRPPHKRAAPPKAYISIFICFATKGVHIELVSDLTTSAFLDALRRFTSRRGVPGHMHSDNGRNFEGAKNELQELYHMLTDTREVESIQSTLANEGITWHMTPPKSPHFGGLWEAAVKVAKKHLHRQLGNSRLSFEDMSTVLAQVEASMNSRPLVPLSEDPNDLTALTPAHFLIGSTMHAIPSPNVRNVPKNRLDHYQQLQALHQEFWHRWRAEYLHELQRDTKVRAPNNELKPGRLVVIVDDFQAPLKWPLARIIQLHPGKDDLTRVVSLRTSRGIVKRPVVKICLLPLEDTDESVENPQPAEEDANPQPVQEDVSPASDMLQN